MKNCKKNINYLFIIGMSFAVALASSPNSQELRLKQLTINNKRLNPNNFFYSCGSPKAAQYLHKCSSPKIEEIFNTQSSIIEMPHELITDKISNQDLCSLTTGTLIGNFLLELEPSNYLLFPFKFYDSKDMLANSLTDNKCFTYCALEKMIGQEETRYYFLYDTKYLGGYTPVHFVTLEHDFYADQRAIIHLNEMHI